jgi:hypothetical protein
MEAAMTRKPLFLVYDKRSRANTRTDTVPCAVRFDEDSSLFGGIEERTERDLLPYAIRPELPPLNDDPTVVDGPLSGTARAAGRISEVRKASDPPPPPLSGPHHDDLGFSLHELEKTVRLSQPPDLPQRRAAESNAESITQAESRPAEQALLRSANRPTRRWILLLAALLAAAPAFLFGMSLGNGRLQRAARALVGGQREEASGAASERAASAAPVAAPAAPAVRSAPVTNAAPVTAPPVRPSATTAPAEARKVPAVRFEDLAIVQEQPPAEAEQPERRRAKGVRRERR